MHVVSKETEKISLTLWIIGALSVLNLMLS